LKSINGYKLPPLIICKLKITNNDRLLLVLALLIATIISSSFLELNLSYSQTLGNIKDLSTNATDAHDPKVLVSGSNIYSIWVDFITGNDDIYFKRSIDSGASFGDTINLSNNPGDSYNFKVSSSGDYIFIVWQDETSGVNGTDDIFFKRSIDGGASFGNVINLSNNTGDSTDPDIASTNDGGNYVVWRDDSAGIEQILFQRSSDNGASFETGLSEHLTLSNNTVKNIDAIEPQIASDKSNVYVIWSQGNFDQGLTDIFLKRSTDGGANFDNVINLSNNPNSQSSLPSIVLLNNYVYTSWADGPFNNGEVFYRNSDDSGTSFGNIINLSNDTGDSIRPEIAVSEPNVFIVWQSGESKIDNIFFKRSTDGGASFGDTINLSNNKGNSMNPEFSVNSSSNVYAVWQNQAGNNKTHDIFLKRSTDGGASFGSIVNLSNDIGYSTDPDIASANDASAYIVWRDNFEGRSKVFFRAVN
jgi:hypothetical protein